MKNYKIGFWLVFLVSFLLLFAPISVGGKDGFGLDKVIHAVIFFALVFFALRAFPSQKFAVVILILAYAFISEYIQGAFLPLRHFDWYDIVSDLIGLAAGIGFKRVGKCF